MSGSTYPLKGIKVVEFSHMVLGPSCGLILADLGADVVKVEPAPEGDKTRLLPWIRVRFLWSIQSEQTKCHCKFEISRRP
ncbi:MAG: hypothetical protein CM15mP85_00170 [Rhodobacterales bacterium]|nr:MAG: hypothetical protein CM15mP85_00170 [Rhodobacterales bacterium]